MALSDKNIVITPSTSLTPDPKIVFSGADASTAAQNITLNVYPQNSGTLSFDGSAGQLFSISNSLSGTIFSVNDVSGIPSIEVQDTGLIKLGEYSGNILLGTATDTGEKLQINGQIRNPSVWINDGIGWNSYNENIRLFAAAGNGASTIAFNATGISGTPVTSIIGWSDRLEFRYGGASKIVIYSTVTDIVGLRIPSGQKLTFVDQVTTSDHISLYGSGAGGYGIGVESNTLYYRSAANHRWYVNSLANGGTAGNWMTLTSSGLTVATSITGTAFYASNWIYSNTNAMGMYNASTNTHLYSEINGGYTIAGNGSRNANLRFRDNHNNTIRGYIGTDAAGFGLWAAGGAWAVKIKDDNNGTLVNSWQVEGTLTVGSTTASYIYMTDTDHTTRSIHCNSNLIGFLNSSSGWGSYCDNTGNWISDFSVRAPIFYDSADTAYYIDPNSTSKIIKLYIRNGGATGVGWGTGLVMGDDTNYWNLIQDGGIARSRNYGTGGFEWWNAAGSNLVQISSAGALNAAGAITGTSVNGVTGLSSTSPTMNGTVAVGTGTTVARADHVHPVDTSRQPLDADLTAIAALAGTSGFLKKTAADTWTLDTAAYTTNTGTVTSVSGTGTVSGLTLTGSVSTSGSLTLGGAITGFLPSSGGTLSGTLISNGYLSPESTRFLSPLGASYTTSTPAPVGAFRIKLPVNSRTWTAMFMFTVNIYSYTTGSTESYRIGGHQNGTDWYNISVYQISESKSPLTVRFGYVGADACVWIGETNTTWSYPQVFVTDFQNGYSNINNNWAGAWTITLQTAFDTVQQTKTPGRVWNSVNDGSGSGLDADLLDGFNAVEAATASTVVVRTINGYINASYFNSNRGDETSAAASYLYDTGDGYIRKKTLANTKAEIVTSASVIAGLGFTPYNSTNPSGYYASGSNASFGTLTASSGISASGASAANAYTFTFRDNKNGVGSYASAQFVNTYGNHSWGAVAEFRTEGASDRPSIVFSSTNAAHTWSVGYVSGTDDHFRITQNHGLRNSGAWGTERLKIGTDGAVTVSGNVVNANFGIVIGTGTHTYQAGSLGYTDVNWGMIFRGPRTGAIAAFDFRNYVDAVMLRLFEDGRIEFGSYLSKLANGDVRTARNGTTAGTYYFGTGDRYLHYDGSNFSFGGQNVYAGTFYGALSGNANTATNFNNGTCYSSGGTVTVGNLVTNNLGSITIGDDIKILDISVANSCRIEGLQNPDRAYLVFGNGDTNSLYRVGTGALTYSGAFTVSGATNVAAIYTSDWFRSNSANYGMYNQSTGTHFYSDANGAYNIAGNGSQNARLLLRDSHQGTVRGYLYSDGNGFGLLGPDGNWAINIPGNSSGGGSLTGPWSVGGYFDANVNAIVRQHLYCRHLEGKNYNDSSTTGNLYLNYDQTNPVYIGYQAKVSFDSGGNIITPGNLTISGNVTSTNGIIGNYISANSGSGEANIHLTYSGQTQGSYFYKNAGSQLGYYNSSTGGVFSINYDKTITFEGAAIVKGQLYVNAGSASSTIEMSDSDEGARMIHCNSNRIGFLNSSAGWGSWCYDDGSWESAGNITAYSDERLKTNWRDVPSNFVELLSKVKSGIYDRTDMQKTQVGVSAQSLREVLPDAVTEGNDENKTLGVVYGNAALLAAVELAKEVVSLKAEIQELKQIMKGLLNG